ncbi:hypothetical protein [Streptomyces europaeiscabiei]|uniref:hypothetical protein n=1 Tax=Streptomyces europaeiscabiei TaxID=146819 RepID=UPI002E143762|nr:hypothetical protein OHB30_35340 [Streptomyces europaeiscabiei]
MGRGLLPTPYFVTSEVTFDPAIEVTVGHPVHRTLAAPGAPAWALLLVAHLRQRFDRFHPGTMQHDALTLSAALQLPFVEFDKMPVAVDGVGRTTRSGTGVPVRVSLSARYPAFMRRLSQRLDPAWKPAAEGPDGTEPH